MTKEGGDTRKQAWKFQEGAVVLALTQLLGKPSDIHWDYTPKGMSIDSDVLIGEDPDHPDIVVFVTHASAERAGEKKFWRTVAEAIEAKRLRSHPKILSVLYPGNVKGALKGIYKTLFDAHLHLDEKFYGQKLDKAFAKLTVKYGKKSKDDCLKILEQSVADGEIREFASFKRDIKVMLSRKSGSMHPVMSAPFFARRTRQPKKARLTSLRRSTCKLYSLPLEVRQALLSGKNIPSLPPHALLLGWFSEDMAGNIELVDDELREFLSTARVGNVEFLCAQVDRTLPSFRQYAETLHLIGETQYCNEWILDHFAELKTQRGMAKALDEVFADPQGPLSKIADRPVALNYHWLFQTLMSILRAETGRADGYGYSMLGTEAGREREINAFAGTTIAPYINLTKNLNNGLRADIARVLSGHLTRLGLATVARLLTRTALVMAQSAFNFQMMNYRFYNPIDWLVVARLKRERISCQWPETHDSFLSTSDGAIASRTGNLIRVGNGRAWIKCQSAYDGRIDKRKELCGRVGAMKLCYTARQLADKNFYLVIDGSFDDEDLRLFGQAGWDGVFYYDELDELITCLR
jgi:hypothetical protein